jgi:hypothetical protein
MVSATRSAVITWRQHGECHTKRSDYVEATGECQIQNSDCVGTSPRVPGVRAHRRTCKRARTIARWNHQAETRDVWATSIERIDTNLSPLAVKSSTRPAL